MNGYADTTNRHSSLMGYADEFSFQSRFNTNYGLSSKIMLACEPLGNYK